MKYVKMLGFAAMAAAVLMAFTGVGTASATVICKNNSNTETCSEPYAIGTEGTASIEKGNSALLTNTEGESLNTCTGSTVTGKLKSQGKEKPALSELTTLTWSGCNFLTKTINPGLGELHWIKGTDNGTLTTGGVEVTINTLFFGSCIYGFTSGTDVGTTVGGNPGSLTVNAVAEKFSGSNIVCPATTKFTAKYVATSPTAGWVSNG
jgi:hypothetical protein